MAIDSLFALSNNPCQEPDNTKPIKGVNLGLTVCNNQNILHATSEEPLHKKRKTMTLTIPEDDVLRSLLSVAPHSCQFLLKFSPEDVLPQIIP